MFFPVYTLFYLTIIVNSGITTEEPIEIVDVNGIDPYVILAVSIILFSIFVITAILIFWLKKINKSKAWSYDFNIELQNPSFNILFS